METLKLKTNIKCAGCVAKVTPFLNEAAGEGNWNVDYNDPQKVLTINNHPDFRKISEALEKAGYKGEEIK